MMQRTCGSLLIIITLFLEKLNLILHHLFQEQIHMQVTVTIYMRLNHIHGALQMQMS